MMTKKKFIVENIFLVIVILGIAAQITLTYFLNQIKVRYFKEIVNNWNLPAYGLLTFGDCEENLLKTIDYQPVVSGGRDYFGNVIRIPNNQTFGINAISKPENYTVKKFNNKSLCSNISFADNYLRLTRNSTQLKNTIGKDSYGNYLIIYGPMQNTTELDAQSPVNVSFKINEVLPCLDSEYSNFTYENVLDFYYDKNKCPNEKNDSSYQLFGTQKKIDFYKENNFSTTIKNYQEYRINDQDNLSLFTRTYIGVNASCVINESLFESVESMSIKIEGSLNWNTTLLLLYLPFFLLFLVKYTVMLTSYFKRKEPIPGYTKPLMMIISILNFIFCCVLFATISTMQTQDIQTIFGENCLDKNFYPMLEKSLFFLKYIFYANLVCLVIHFLICSKYGIRTAIKYAS